MISSTRTWLRRNRTNFAIGAGVLGAGYVAGQYILSKITETRQRMSEDRVAKENLRRRFQQNQEDCTITVLALLPTATENILDALPVERITQDLQQKKAERLGRNIGALDGASLQPSSGPSSVVDEDGKSLASLQSEGYVHASQMAASCSGSENPAAAKPTKGKAQLWNDLKISSITRAFTLLYTLSLLTLLTRIQLNLLGRRNYLSSVVSMASHSPQEPTISLENLDDDNTEPTYGNDFETNRKFLTFSWWLLHRGWRDVMAKVEVAVKAVYGPLNPREDVPLERLSALILEVRKRVEGATPEARRSHRWLPYLLPPQDQEGMVLRESGMLKAFSPSESASIPSPPSSLSPTIPASESSQSASLRRLLDETADLIDSPTFTQILTLLLDTTFSHLTDHQIRTEAYKLPDPTSVPSVQEIPEIDTGLTKAKLATILAVMTRQAHAIGSGVPNRYAQAIEGVKELEAFAAVIYSSHFEFEALGGDSSREAAKEAQRSQEGAVSTAEGKKEAGGVVGTATDMFENVWGRITG
ncbi:MAG: hypothetical protein L6R37_001552 [Teloschistes peruensis]|nr:MAG: hypothetical protein L6R37_001552 [Teloschistes peruensis]